MESWAQFQNQSLELRIALRSVIIWNDVFIANQNDQSCVSPEDDTILYLFVSLLKINFYMNLHFFYAILSQFRSTLT